MAYADVFNAANDAMFQGRCMVALWRAAQDIVAEPANTPSHAARLDWAVKVLRDGLLATPRQVAMQVLRNPTVAANPGAATDGDIQFQVNSVLADIMQVG